MSRAGRGSTPAFAALRTAVRPAEAIWAISPSSSCWHVDRDRVLDVAQVDIAGALVVCPQGMEADELAHDMSLGTGGPEGLAPCASGSLRPAVAVRRRQVARTAGQGPHQERVEDAAVHERGGRRVVEHRRRVQVAGVEVGVAVARGLPGPLVAGGVEPARQPATSSAATSSTYSSLSSTAW